MVESDHQNEVRWPVVDLYLRIFLILLVLIIIQ